MIPMMDEIFDRQYRAGRAQLNATILDALSQFGSAVGNAFSVLHRIEYSAPWTATAKRARLH